MIVLDHISGAAISVYGINICFFTRSFIFLALAFSPCTIGMTPQCSTSLLCILLRFLPTLGSLCFFIGFSTFFILVVLYLPCFDNFFIVMIISILMKCPAKFAIFGFFTKFTLSDCAYTIRHLLNLMFSYLMPQDIFTRNSPPLLVKYYIFQSLL